MLPISKSDSHDVSVEARAITAKNIGDHLIFNVLKYFLQFPSSESKRSEISFQTTCSPHKTTELKINIKW